jgi:limonene-1,2-epoxide hydrolase
MIIKKMLAGLLMFVFASAPTVVRANDAAQSFMAALIEAYNEDRFDAIKAMFHEDARIYFMGERESKPQPVEFLLKRWQEESKSIADRRLGLKRIFPVANGLIAQYVFYGLPAQSDAGAPPAKLSGREGILFLEIENGKIQEWREYTNPNLMLDLASGAMLPHSKIPDWPLVSEIVAENQEAGTQAAVQGFYQAINDQNSETAVALLSENAAFYNHTISAQESLREVLGIRLQNYFEEFKNRKVVIEDLHIAGPYAVLRLFNYTDALALPSCDVVKVKDGKIEALEEYFNISEIHSLRNAPAVVPNEVA